MSRQQRGEWGKGLQNFTTQKRIQRGIQFSEQFTPLTDEGRPAGSNRKTRITGLSIKKKLSNPPPKWGRGNTPKADAPGQVQSWKR